MEQFETLFDQLECFCTLAFIDCVCSFLKVFVGARLLDRQELNDFVMVGVEGMRSPHAPVALVDAVDGPEQFAFQDQTFDVAWVQLEALVKLGEGKVFVAGSNAGECVQISEFDVF